LLDPITGQPLTASDDSDTGTDASADPVPNPSQTETPDGTGATDGDPTNDPTVLSVPLIVPDTVLSGFVFFDRATDDTFNASDSPLSGRFQGLPSQVIRSLRIKTSLWLVLVANN
jgi:hypothetical protein